MNLTTLTLDERERLAYAEGYTEAAALLGDMADLERERDNLQEELDALQYDHDKLQDAHDTLKDERDSLEADRLEAQEVAKTYRAALMALEAEVSPAMREFIREVLA